MNNTELLFFTGVVRFIVYCIVITTSVHQIYKSNSNKMLYIGDLLFAVMSALSFLTQNLWGWALGFATIWVFTPAFFIWGLTRVIDMFSVNNFLNKHEQKTK